MILRYLSQHFKMSLIVFPGPRRPVAQRVLVGWCADCGGREERQERVPRAE